MVDQLGELVVTEPMPCMPLFFWNDPEGEAFPQVRDNLVVGVELAEGQGYYMPLFVVLSEGAVLDEELKANINQRLRASVSPNHGPDEIIEVPYIPYTLTGKKLEVLIKNYS